MRSLAVTKWIPLIVLALLVFINGSAFSQDYVLGEGDLIKITVYENDDLTTQARISGEGSINFPLVGAVKLGGMDVKDAEKKLNELLSDGFIKNPHVQIFVVENRSKKVTILGEVHKPGLYELNGNVTVLEMISKAEGLTDNAGNTLTIKRKAQVDPSQPARDSYITIDLKALMEHGDLSANTYLLDGDSIFITKSGMVYVTGEVSHPGAYKVDQETTVMKAIALAGGLTDKAASRRITLIRKFGSEEKEMKVEMNFIVQPNDVISVPESFL